MGSIHKESVMKTKKDGILKAFEPYKQREVDLILSITPTHTNVRRLATALGRSEDAIMTIYSIAYSGKWLKGMLSGMDTTQNNVVTKVASAKKKLGIFIGHEPD
jgi:hypothetical protein